MLSVNTCLSTMLLVVALSIPTHAEVLQATNLDGIKCVLSVSSLKATVLIFVLHDCPVCNRYAPEIMRITKDYGKADTALYVVYEESDLTIAQARAHAKAYGLTCGLLYDPSHKLAHQLGATAVPEAVVLSPSGVVAYHGRIDNAFYHFGMISRQPTTHDLRDALDALLAGKDIPVSETPVVGCSIPPD